MSREIVQAVIDLLRQHGLPAGPGYKWEQVDLLTDEIVPREPLSHTLNLIQDILNEHGYSGLIGVFWMPGSEDVFGIVIADIVNCDAGNAIFTLECECGEWLSVVIGKEKDL